MHRRCFSYILLSIRIVKNTIEYIWKNKSKRKRYQRSDKNNFCIGIVTNDRQIYRTWLQCHIVVWMLSYILKAKQRNDSHCLSYFFRQLWQRLYWSLTSSIFTFWYLVNIEIKMKTNFFFLARLYFVLLNYICSVFNVF